MCKCNWDIEVKTGDERSSWTELLRDSESRKVYSMESKPSTVH
jgi:1,2-phenylacetyl-CoA epoxidase PaaB subunit